MVIALCVGSPGETRSCVLPSPIIIIITPTTHNVVVVVMFVVVSGVRSSQFLDQRPSVLHHPDRFSLLRRTSPVAWAPVGPGCGANDLNDNKNAAGDLISRLGTAVCHSDIIGRYIYLLLIAQET